MARVIGQRAQIWLLDEPLSGLDEASQGLVIGLVGEHTAVGGIAVIASHQPFALEGLQILAIEQFVPPLPDGEGIEGWGNGGAVSRDIAASNRSEEHTSELQSLMRIPYAVFFLKKKKT